MSQESEQAKLDYVRHAEELNAARVPVNDMGSARWLRCGIFSGIAIESTVLVAVVLSLNYMQTVVLTRVMVGLGLGYWSICEVIASRKLTLRWAWILAMPLNIVSFLIATSAGL